jgi:transposase
VVNLKGWMMILELYQQGLSVSAIAERTGHDRKTVRKVIRRGLVVPKYAWRVPRPTLIGPYEPYLRERVAAWPELSGVRLLREVRERGYAGGVTQLNDFLRAVRPPVYAPFQVRFETPAGRQAQVEFAQLMVEFTEQPGVQHRVWLFAMVLGHSRYLWGQYVLHQDLGTVLRCHMLAFEHFGGTPHEILYDRMKTAVLGEATDDTGIVYNDKLIGLGAHYGFKPRACKAYRAKTKGKIERPFRYVRANFFLARSFANLEDLNRQLRAWLDTVANARLHGSTGRVVAEHFAAERGSLKSLPAGRFDAVLRTERRVSHEGMVSVGGNLYSVPDGTVKRVLEVETTADCVRIHDGHRLVAVHALLHGRRQRSLLPGHRQSRRSNTAPEMRESHVVRPPGHSVVRRALEVYAAVAERLGAASRLAAAPSASTGGAR